MSMTATGFSTALVNLKNAGQTKTDMLKGVDEAAKEFEGVFISEMLSHMFGDTEPNSLFGGGKGEQMFKSLLIEQYGKAVAGGNGIGLSSQIKAMMIDMQQKTNGGTP